jgi:hypothetical protein
MVVAISDYEAGGALDNLRQQVKLVNISWSNRDVGDHSRIANSCMYTESVEGLPEHSVLAESSFSLEPLAAVGTGKQASWQRHRVANGEGRIIRSEGQKLLPEIFFDLPEVSRLAAEGGAMDLVQGGEPLTVVTPEVTEDRLVGVQAKKLTNDFDGENFGVRKFRQRTTRSETSVLGSVVYETEDGDDEGAKIHERRPPLRWLVWSLPSVVRSSLFFKFSTKLAHGVS